MAKILRLSLLITLLFSGNLLGNQLQITEALFDDRAQIVTESAAGIDLEFDLDDVIRQDIVQNGVNTKGIALPGEGLVYEYGLPMLPAISRFIVVPPDVGISFSYEPGKTDYESADYPPALCLEEALKPDTPVESNWHNSIFPPVAAEMSEPIVIRGVRMVRVTTYPVRYDAPNRRFLRNSHIRTKLEYTDEEPVNPVQVPVRRNRSPQFLKFMKALAVNGDVVGRDDPDWGEPRPYVGHYLVIMNERCQEYVAPFIEWRRMSGWKVDVISLSNSHSTNVSRISDAIEDLYDSYLDDGVDPFDHILLVGDRSGYSGGSGSPGWQLAAPTGTSRWANPPHSDYTYACLEGNDSRPDVAISRWCAGSEDMLELFWGRTKAYEMEPHMEDTEWFTRGGVFSQHWGNSATSAWHITIHTNVRWAAEMLEHLGYDDVRTYEDYDWDQQGQRVGPFERDLFNDGANVHLGRAENYYWRNNFNGVDENVTFPIRLVASGHGEWTNWNIMRSQTADGEDLKGAVAGTNGWGGPATFDMSVIWLGLVRSVMLLDMPFGWGRSYAITNPELFVPNWNSATHLYAKTDFDAYGDPGVQPWNGVPRMVETEVTETVTPETRLIEVRVRLEDDTVAVPNAQVTLYIPGNDMPDYDDEGYPDYDDMHMVTRKSDADGKAFFSLDGEMDLLEDDVVWVTVTGRDKINGDIRPHFDELIVTEPRRHLEISGYTLVDRGDDEEINPGDTLSLSLIAGNFGTNLDAGEVSAVVSSLSEYLVIEENEINFGDIAAGDESEGDNDIRIIVQPYTPDGRERPTTRPVILVELFSDDEVWRTGIELDPHAPHFVVDEVHGGIIIDAGEENDVELTVKNTGRLDSDGVSGIIESHGMGVGVARREAQFPDINEGRTGRTRNDGFTVAGNTMVSPGAQFRIMLRMLTENGFEDTTYFYLQVDEPREEAPQGPDNYGYVCYDDTDTEWGDFATEYEWIEISRDEDDRDYNGIKLDFEGDSDEDVGENIMIDLTEDGFFTQFYGYEYSQISVSTNGYICLGDQEEITNFQNWPLDQAMGGGAGMIAPYWDWLKFGDDSGIYYYYDQDEHMLIIEWYKLRHKSGGNRDLTFQVFLYDKRYWRSATGDPKIKFQYKSISHSRGVAGSWVTNVPYASVGISSPDGDAGISYFWNDEYPITSAEIEDERAILFATSVQNFLSGYLEGYVHDVETEEPVANVTVITDYGFVATTDSSGWWFIAEALAEKPFNITARKLGYNDSTYVDMLLDNEDSVQVDFGLLHPEFSPAVMQLQTQLDPGYTDTLLLSIENTGNGPLEWRMERHLPRGADVDPWQYREGLVISDSVDNPRLNGVVFADGEFYVSAKQVDDEEPHKIYVLSDEGEYLRDIDQPDPDDRQGMKDLAWDKNNEILWGAVDQTVYGLSTEGDSITSFTPDIGGRSSLQALAWDEDREVLWLSAIVSNIMAYNADGEMVTSLDRRRLRLYGLAYWPDAPDDYKLFILTEPTDGNVQVYQMNPEDGDTMFVTELLHPDGLDLENGGIFATNQFDVYSWVFMHLASAGSHDRVDIWQLDARKDWFKLYFGEIEAELGIIDAGTSEDFDLVLNSTDLPIDINFDAMLEFYHNAADLQTVIDVRLGVIGPREPSMIDLIEPADGDTINPVVSDTVSFAWTESSDPNAEEDPRYELWFEVDGDETSMRFDPEQTGHTTTLTELSELLEISLEVEFPINWWVNIISGPDTVVMEESFELKIVPNSTGSSGEVPVEFGLNQIYPSPFNSMTTVNFGMDQIGEVSLAVYDLLGREVTRLFNGKASRGYHRISWDAKTVPSGVYVIRLSSLGRTESSKVTLLR